MKSRVTSNRQKIVLLAIVLLMNLSGIANLGTYGSALSALMLVITLYADVALFHVALLNFLFGVAPLVLPRAIFDLPATIFLVPFLLSIPLVLLVPRARFTLEWLRIGYFDGVTLFWMVLTVVLSSSALIGWAFWTDSLGVGEKMMRGFIQYPSWLIVMLGIPAFAIFNAFAEEAFYRGVLQESLSLTFRAVPIVILFQATAFGAAHYRMGFPNGLMGYFMVFTYGLMLGFLRYRSKGMMAPFLTHIFADLTIGYFLYWNALNHSNS
jgi:uncharacterized protein